MSGRRNISILFAFVLSVSMITASVTALCMAERHARAQFQLLERVSQNILEELPEAENTVMKVIKDYKDTPAKITEKNVLNIFGYDKSDFISSSQRNSVVFAVIGFLFGGSLFLVAFWLCHRKDTMRIRALTDYLEQVNTGNDGVLLKAEEGDFCKLQDEIYKTVTFACQTRDFALKAKQNYAENLSNIAHQLKTPITAISLSTQMINEPTMNVYAEQIQRQLKRLTHLEEALLLLSRLDAGTLPFRQEPVDVFTLLTLAADNLQEILSRSEVHVNIPELGEVFIHADLEWTMEAVMNLMKNCMEHIQKGQSIHCSYGQNPLYTQILIWDEGEGFANEDIPHLFKRFYRGKNAKDGGIGIGLSLAKAIIESENGTICANNRPDGGACFEIRFYRS